MQALKAHTGIVAVLDRANVDTDAIIPKQFLRKTERTGFGKNLFHEWRYLDYEGRTENPEFILNREVFRDATILVARDNFGCGSSREHAAWALKDYGFRVIIAPSFAEIFYHNALKNGILAVRLDAIVVDDFFKQILASPGVTMTVDLEKKTVTSPDGQQHSFDIPAFFRTCLLKGLDPIGWTLQYTDKIHAYEQRIQANQPWLA